MIGTIKNLRQFVPTYTHHIWQSASSALSLDGQNQCWGSFFFPQNSRWWTGVLDSEVTKWQEHLLPKGVAASAHRRMKMAITKWANQPIKIIAGLLACRVLKICKLQSFLCIMCRSNYLLLLPAVGGWTYAAGNLQLHGKGRRHPDGMCTDGASLCWQLCPSSSTRWPRGASGERGTAVWGHYSAPCCVGFIWTSFWWIWRYPDLGLTFSPRGLMEHLLRGAVVRHKGWMRLSQRKPRKSQQWLICGFIHKSFRRTRATCFHCKVVNTYMFPNPPVLSEPRKHLLACLESLLCTE